MEQMRLGIAGLGVLGCSIALRYRSQYLQAQVIGFDPKSEHLEIARSREAITATADSLETLAAQVDILVLAAPLAYIIQMLDRLSSGSTLPQLIMDVASVKAQVVAAGSKLPAFVGTHPMAGSELTGPRAARAELFVGRPWAYIATDNRDASEQARAFIEMMGANAIAVDAAAHDALVARTSHLPQTLATLLAMQALREPTLGIFGQGLLDMTRLAHSADSVWGDIYAANADAVVHELTQFQQLLAEFSAAIQSGNRDAVRAFFTRANSAVAKL